MTVLDYGTVRRYWSEAGPSILGPYMMDGFGFPGAAGHFRFRAERQIVKRLTNEMDEDGCVLDLGSGIGYWTEYFAQRFARVTAVEASRPLFEAMEKQCASYNNVNSIHGDVLLFQPEDQYDVIFLGGMLMYLNEEDVISLLKNITLSLRTGGMILCRETTVRQGVVARQGEYQAVYRSVDVYQRIFAECGLSVAKLEINTPYVLMQMGCEFVKKWKTMVPARLQFIPILGRLVYWGLRLGYPWITRVPAALGLEYPKLTNHFFVLQPDTHPTSNSTTRDRVAQNARD
jgi:trans-aconitate methyltransferase